MLTPAKFRKNIAHIQSNPDLLHKDDKKKNALALNPGSGLMPTGAVRSACGLGYFYDGLIPYGAKLKDLQNIVKLDKVAKSGPRKKKGKGYVTDHLIPGSITMSDINTTVEAQRLKRNRLLREARAKKKAAKPETEKEFVKRVKAKDEAHAAKILEKAETKKRGKEIAKEAAEKAPKGEGLNFMKHMKRKGFAKLYDKIKAEERQLRQQGFKQRKARKMIIRRHGSGIATTLLEPLLTTGINALMPHIGSAITSALNWLTGKKKKKGKGEVEGEGFRDLFKKLKKKALPMVGKLVKSIATNEELLKKVPLGDHAGTIMRVVKAAAAAEEEKEDETTLEGEGLIKPGVVRGGNGITKLVIRGRPKGSPNKKGLKKNL